jgi:hypothetical protein
MTTTPRRLALLAVATLLITTPVWAPAADVTGSDYEYRAALVTVEDNRLEVVGDHPRLDGIDGVDCLRERLPTRLCAFESALLDDSARRAPYPGVRHVAGDPSLDSPERYVAFPGDGRVFRRTTGYDDSQEAYILRLERVDATDVLAEQATSIDAVSRPVRETVETGSARVDSDPITEPILVTTNGRFYVVYSAGQQSFLSEKPLTERLFELGAIALGIVTLRRAWAMKTTEE